jgi:hypothetical protein
MPMPCPQPWPLNTSELAATLSASAGTAVVVDVVAAVVVVTTGVVVVVAARVVVTGRVVVVAALVETGSGAVVTTVVGGIALGPVAIGSEGAGSATTSAEAIPPNPSSASVVSSRARRSTDSR